MAICGTSCIQTETSFANPEEKVFCDISTQLDNENQIIKSELRFYIKDSLGMAPYFLDAPVFMNNEEMVKKFVGHKGVYYSIISSNKNENSISISFTNLDDVEYRIEVPMYDVDLEVRENKMTSNAISDWKLDEDENIILIDSSNHLFNLKKRKNDNEISLGSAKLVKVITKDSTYQLKDKLWIKYNSKSLSKSKLINIIN